MIAKSASKFFFDQLLQVGPEMNQSFSPARDTNSELTMLETQIFDTVLKFTDRLFTNKPTPNFPYSDRAGFDSLLLF